MLSEQRHVTPEDLPSWIGAGMMRLLAAATRSEPAHREAYVRITKAQVAFPQILSAFETVARWLTEQGLPASSAPREVYFTG